MPITSESKSGNNGNSAVVGESAIDRVFSTQSELGPKVPDGGYGWIVFACTLFFQFFLSPLIVVSGVLLASTNTSFNDKDIHKFWNNDFLYVPIFYQLINILMEPTCRDLYSKTAWPRICGSTGNCLTCAGLLFVWIGKLENLNNSVSTKIWFISAGGLIGLGSAMQISECEIILAQYFKSKHFYVLNITQMAVALGFITTPVLISSLLSKNDFLSTIFIYQSILLAGQVFHLALKRPEYSRKQVAKYSYVSENVGDDEEDIFSKSATELKLKTDNVLKKIELKKPELADLEQPSSSTSNYQNRGWIKFEDEVDGENLEKFNDEKPRQKYVVLDEANNYPMPLFSESEVNMNNSYSFDDDNDAVDSRNINHPSVFLDLENVSPKTSNFNIEKYSNILKTPTFYKSLLTVITMKYSCFVFFALFPSYLTIQLKSFKKAASLIGCISFGSLVFSGFSSWIDVNKTKRPIFLFVLCWIGANGYFLIAVYHKSEAILMFGAVEVILSISSLQHIGGPLLGLTIRGESSSEYGILCFLTAIAFSVFLFIDISYRNCFLLMALLQIITGLLWVSNFFYKKMREFY